MKNKNFKFSNTGNAFLVAFGTLYALSLAYELILMIAFRGGEIPIAAEWCSYLINPIAFIGSMLIYARQKNVDVVSAAKLNGKISGKQVGIVLLLAIFCIMGFLPISNIFLDILGRLGFEYDLSFVDTSASVGAYFLGLLLLAVMPAFAEEFMIRGVVLNAAEQKRDYAYAILITAAMFSLMHGNPIQTVHQFFLSMVMSYLVLVSRSLWPAVILHFTNNFLSLTLDWPLARLFELTGMENMHAALWYLLWFVMLIIGCTMVVYLLKKFTNVTRDKAKFGDAVVIDVYPEGEKKFKRNDIINSFLAIFSIFKRGGLKRAYHSINDTIREFVPSEEVPPTLTREDFFPSNIKLALVVLAVLWIINFVFGFVG